jgi:hypothetical protein
MANEITYTPDDLKKALELEPFFVNCRIRHDWKESLVLSIEDTKSLLDILSRARIRSSENYRDYRIKAPTDSLVELTTLSHHQVAEELMRHALDIPDGE